MSAIVMAKVVSDCLTIFFVITSIPNNVRYIYYYSLLSCLLAKLLFVFLVLFLVLPILEIVLFFCFPVISFVSKVYFLFFL